MKCFADELCNGDHQVDPQYKNAFEKLCNEMGDLADRAASYPSIDVLARTLYLREDTVELRKLKATLSAYYVLEQSRSPSDPRYGFFFAYMADRDVNGILAMPTNMRVVSWNYDMQFEKSFSELIHDPYFKEKRDSGRMLQVVPTGVESHDHHDDIFSIYKLNGTAGARDNGEMLIKSYDPVVYGQPGRIASDDLRLVLNFYQNATSNDEPYLQFTWEDDNRRNDVLGLIERFAPVEAVVVLGYSFPPFNRDLDRKMFEMLCPNEIFLQVAGDENVMDRLVGLGVNSKIVRIIRDREQFHIPNSYSPSVRLSRRSRELPAGDAGS